MKNFDRDFKIMNVIFWIIIICICIIIGSYTLFGYGAVKLAQTGPEQLGSYVGEFLKGIEEGKQQ